MGRVYLNANPFTFCDLESDSLGLWIWDSNPNPLDLVGAWVQIIFTVWKASKRYIMPSTFVEEQSPMACGDSWSTQVVIVVQLIEIVRAKDVWRWEWRSGGGGWAVTTWCDIIWQEDMELTLVILNEKYFLNFK